MTERLTIPRIPAWLIPIVLMFLPDKIMGISTRRILENSPAIEEAANAVAVVIEKLKDDGKSEEEAEKAVAQMIAKKRSMTAEEDRAWANRAMTRLEMEAEAHRLEREGIQ